MKRVVLLTSIFLQSLLSYSQSVAVNTDGTPADTSAMLDVKSSIKGILIPRMSTAERQAIITPATGLLVFDNDVLTFWFFNGVNWIEIAISSTTKAIRLYPENLSCIRKITVLKRQTVI